MKISKILASVAVASLAAGAVAATASAYNGYIAFQNGVWTFRNPFNDATYGAASDFHADKIIMWGNNSDTTWPDLVDEHYDWTIKGYVFDANYTDVEITGDGTYTVSADGFNWAQDGCTSFNTIQISTDIPAGGAVISDAKVIIDGEVTATIAEPEVEDGDYLLVSVVNGWNDKVPVYTGAYPTESLSVEFTVTGLDAEGGDADGDAAGSTDGATGEDKNSADTGVEGVAAVAGLAIVAGGAMLLSKKRK